MQEGKGFKQQNDELRQEVEQLSMERHRMQEVDQDNGRMQQEIIRMQSYMGEQEVQMEQHRDRLREAERNLSIQVE